MTFVCISENFPAYGTGHQIEPNRFETPYGVKLYFYTPTNVQEDFGPFGLESMELIT